jgi:hypothetical protein
VNRELRNGDRAAIARIWHELRPEEGSFAVLADEVPVVYAALHRAAGLSRGALSGNGLPASAGRACAVTQTGVVT